MCLTGGSTLPLVVHVYRVLPPVTACDFIQPVKLLSFIFLIHKTGFKSDLVKRVLGEGVLNGGAETVIPFKALQ